MTDLGKVHSQCTLARSRSFPFTHTNTWEVSAWKRNTDLARECSEGTFCPGLIYVINRLKVWDIKDAENRSAVAFAPVKLLPDLSKATYGFLDSTYQSIPYVEDAYQLLVFLFEVYGKVSGLILFHKVNLITFSF